MKGKTHQLITVLHVRENFLWYGGWLAFVQPLPPVRKNWRSGPSSIFSEGRGWQYIGQREVQCILLTTLNHHLFKFLVHSWVTLNSYTKNKYNVRYLILYNQVGYLDFANLIQKLKPSFFLTATTSFIRRLS